MKVIAAARSGSVATAFRFQTAVATFRWVHVKERQVVKINPKSLNYGVSHNPLCSSKGVNNNLSLIENDGPDELQ